MEFQWKYGEIMSQKSDEKKRKMEGKDKRRRNEGKRSFIDILVCQLNE